MYNGHDGVAELLCQRGADANTPLQVASRDGCVDVVRWLLDHGADPDSQQGGRPSPICLATVNGHAEVVRTLLRPGAHNNAVVGATDNLVHLATFYASPKKYRKQTNIDLITHPLMAQFQTCNNPSDILFVLRLRVRFGLFTSPRGDDRSTRCLDSTIHVLHAFSTALASRAGVEHVNSIWILLPKSTPYIQTPKCLHQKSPYY